MCPANVSSLLHGPADVAYTAAAFGILVLLLLMTNFCRAWGLPALMSSSHSNGRMTPPKTLHPSTECISLSSSNGTVQYMYNLCGQIRTSCHQLLLLCCCRITVCSVPLGLVVGVRLPPLMSPISARLALSATCSSASAVVRSPRA